MTKTYPVTGQTVINADERKAVPGLLVTVAELQTMCTSGDWSLVWCDTCGESIAECPALRGKVSTPESWSYRFEEDE